MRHDSAKADWLTNGCKFIQCKQRSKTVQVLYVPQELAFSAQTENAEIRSHFNLFNMLCTNTDHLSRSSENLRIFLCYSVSGSDLCRRFALNSQIRLKRRNP